MIPASAREGFTYAITTDPYDGWVKIGRCGPGADPKARLKSCQTGNARRLRVRVSWPVDVEWDMHRYYKQFRGQGEWFALPMTFIQDMRRFRDLPEPWVKLFAKWTPARVWGEARISINSGPEAVARAFMPAGVAARRGDQKNFVWHPTQRDIELLAQGNPVEFVYFGEEVVGCNTLAPVVGIGGASGKPGGQNGAISSEIQAK